MNLSSLTHRTGRIDFPDLQGLARYRPWGAYSQSKLAMLLFSLELQRRSVAGGWGVASIAAHPGWARTGLLASAGGGLRLKERAMEALSHIFGQSAAAGALPTVHAATAPEAVGGAYYGPDGMGEMTGAPALARLAPQARDTATARRLWEVAEALTGVRFP